MKRLIAVILCRCVLFAGCGGTGLGGEKLNVKSDEAQFRTPQSGDVTAVIETSRGTIKVLLFPDVAPLAVQNFILLAQNGYYDGLTFHRAIEDFLIQTGSPDGSANGGRSAWGLDFPDEFSDLAHNYSGALAMANRGEDTNSSQFYILTTPIGKISSEKVSQMQQAGWREEVINAYKEAGGEPSLDYRYTVFGQVYDGLEVAYKISRAKTDKNDKPEKDVTVNSVTIVVVE